jgi:hypothetical protein
VLCGVCRQGTTETQPRELTKLKHTINDFHCTDARRHFQIVSHSIVAADFPIHRQPGMSRKDSSKYRHAFRGRLQHIANTTICANKIDHLLRMWQRSWRDVEQQGRLQTSSSVDIEFQIPPDTFCVTAPANRMRMPRVCASKISIGACAPRWYDSIN